LCELKPLYTSFFISNFKGIQELTLDLDGNPASKVFVLVGLNESGKTTIMEALSFFHENIRDINEQHLTLHPSGVTDRHSLIPKNKEDNFTDITKISAFFELDDCEENALEAVLRENGFYECKISRKMSISFSFEFEDSSFAGRKTLWSTNIMGRDGKKRGLKKLSPTHKAWSPAYEHIKKNIPPIIYYPNFLFEFPDSIYLEVKEGSKEGPEQAFYRRLLQDVLDSLDNSLDLKKHIIDRESSPLPSNKQSLNSVLSKMGAQITRTVFSPDLSIFGADKIKNKSITVNLSRSDENEALSIELKLKHGEDNFRIRERSLGFRWIFTFLLFTQFRVCRNEGNKGLIFLFDEPASNLHQAAQQRLKNALQGLTKSDVSVIYSTHSHHLINRHWLESTFIVRNKALQYEDDDFNFSPNNIEVEKYRSFINSHPDQHTYFQPILDVLEYRPSNLEAIADVIMVEGKNDFYTLDYFQDFIIKPKKKVSLLPGGGASSLDTAIRLYCAWGRKFTILLDSDKEGRDQRNRYEEMFGNIIKGRVFTLGDIDPDWNGRELEEIFSDDDLLRIQQSSFPDSKTFKKKKFNLAIQENLANANTLDISQLTKEKMEKLLDYLSNSLK
jgi:predicted ATP-dependent endonuclease of OLD family